MIDLSQAPDRDTVSGGDGRSRLHERLGFALLLLGSVVALAACGSPSGSSSAKASGPAITTTTVPYGAASTFTVNGFSYTIVAGPIQLSVKNQAGTHAPPGEHYWDMQVKVHNAQTNREAPLQPAYTSILSNCSGQPFNPSTCSVNLTNAQYGNADLSGDYFHPGQTLQIPYESGGPLPDTVNPQSLTSWYFITQESASGSTPPQSVQLDVPRS